MDGGHLFACSLSERTPTGRSSAASPTGEAGGRRLAAARLEERPGSARDELELRVLGDAEGCLAFRFDDREGQRAAGARLEQALRRRDENRQGVALAVAGRCVEPGAEHLLALRDVHVRLEPLGARRAGEADVD